MVALGRDSLPIAAASLLFLLPGCGPRPVPGTTEPTGGGSGSTHRVEYVVRCVTCTVAFTVDNGTDHAEVEGSFSRRVSVSGRLIRTVTLHVAPREGRVSLASISVNGREVARAGRDDVFAGDVTLTAPLLR